MDLRPRRLLDYRAVVGKAVGMERRRTRRCWLGWSALL